MNESTVIDQKDCNALVDACLGDGMLFRHIVREVRDEWPNAGLHSSIVSSDIALMAIARAGGKNWAEAHAILVSRGYQQEIS